MTRLARVGYDYAIGYLDGGFDVWKKAGKEVDFVTSLPAEQFAERYREGNVKVIDVRKPDEFESGHVKGAENIALDTINDNMSGLSKNETLYVHCAGGYRSMIAASILKSRGFDDVVNIEGGFGAISKTEVSLS